MKYLGIYLNDQLALGVGWRELARRAAGANRGTPLGDALAEVAREIAEDKAELRRYVELTTPNHVLVKQRTLTSRRAK